MKYNHKAVEEKWQKIWEACQFLAQNGFEDIYNGGGFMQLNAALEHYKSSK